MARPLYVLAPEDAPTVRGWVDAGLPVEHLADLEELGSLDGRTPGVVVVAEGLLSPDTLLALARRLSDAPLGWCLALLDGSDGTVRTLGFGLAHDGEAVREDYLSGADGSRVLLDLRAVLAEMSRVRHDLNNPLTSALAEIQLLLFDATDPDLRESLEVVQSQLRRMRDMLVATKHLRLPREG